MEKIKIHLEDIVKRDPFKVPEGYFDNFTSGLMSRLPERQPQPIKAVSLWDKVKPWVYMAAMFIGISLTIKLFTNIPGKVNNLDLYTEKSMNIAVDSDIEDYYNYYEDDLANIYFDDTIADLSN
jgi:hypothetical protein